MKGESAMNKNECIKKLRNIAVVSALRAGEDKVITPQSKNWKSEDGQKNRTYFRITERKNNTKGHTIKSYGYYDNVTNEYVPEDNDLTKDFDFYGYEL